MPTVSGRCATFTRVDFINRRLSKNALIDAHSDMIAGKCYDPGQNCSRDGVPIVETHTHDTVRHTLRSGIYSGNFNYPCERLIGAGWHVSHENAKERKDRYRRKYRKPLASSGFNIHEGA